MRTHHVKDVVGIRCMEENGRLGHPVVLAPETPSPLRLPRICEYQDLPISFSVAFAVRLHVKYNGLKILGDTAT